VGFEILLILTYPSEFPNFILAYEDGPFFFNSTERILIGSPFLRLIFGETSSSFSSRRLQGFSIL